MIVLIAKICLFQLTAKYLFKKLRSGCLSFKYSSAQLYDMLLFSNKCFDCCIIIAYFCKKYHHEDKNAFLT